MELVLINWAAILFWYVIGALSFLAIDAFFIGYNGLNDLNREDLKSAVIWPYTLISLLGTAVKILVNIADRVSDKVSGSTKNQSKTESKKGK